MNIKIKLIKECANGEYGTCEIQNKKTISIEISKKKNTDKYQFFISLLHELLHAWMFIMKANGIEIGIRKEHKWIYSVQAVVIEALKLISEGKQNAKSRILPKDSNS